MIDRNSAEVRDSVHKGNTYVVYDGQELIASVALEPNPTDWDKEIWDNDALNSDTIYLHRIVVHRKHAGKGIGVKLLDWSENFAQQQGAKQIRFDCLASNEGLNTYYQQRYPLKEVVERYGAHCKYEVKL